MRFSWFSQSQSQSQQKLTKNFWSWLPITTCVKRQSRPSRIVTDRLVLPSRRCVICLWHYHFSAAYNPCSPPYLWHVCFDIFLPPSVGLVRRLLICSPRVLFIISVHRDDLSGRQVCPAFSTCCFEERCWERKTRKSESILQAFSGGEKACEGV